MYRFIIYMLALGVFLTATSELVVTGIVAVIAEDMHISLALAGQLVAFYSFAFAIGTPIVISLTSRIDRRKMLLFALLAFVAGSALSALSTTFPVLILARIVLGIGSGVYLVSALGIAAKLVPAGKLGGAVGTIILGFSSAMILGVPIGIAITEWMNWRMIFVSLGALGLIAGAVIYRLLPAIDGDAPEPFFGQFKRLASVAIISGLLLSLFREGGNSVFMTYMAPYLQELFHYGTADVGLVMLGFGVVGAVGSRLGGFGVDRWGTVAVITAALLAHLAAFALMPLSGGAPAIGLPLIGMVVLSMFAAGPAIQTYFIQQAPQSANFILSINTSVIHLGLAAGAGLGGIGVHRAATLAYHPWIAGALLLLALGVGAVGFRAGRKRTKSVHM